MESFIRSFSIHLKYVLGRIHEIVDESNARHTYSGWELMAHAATLSSSACAALPIVSGLSPWAAAACSSSFFVSSQGHCYFLSIVQPPASKDRLDHPICSPTRYFRLAFLFPKEMDALHGQATMLADDFDFLVTVTLENLEALLTLSQICLRSATMIHYHYVDIVQLRREDEHFILNQQDQLRVRAEYTPSWLERLRGKVAGLHADEKYEVIKLDGEWRVPKELKAIHNHVDVFLQGAIETLGYLRSNFRSMQRDISYFVSKNQRNGNFWSKFAREMERLKPLIGELNTLRLRQSTEREKESQRWQDNRAFCVMKSAPKRAAYRAADAAAFAAERDGGYKSDLGPLFKDLDEAFEDCLFFE